MKIQKPKKRYWILIIIALVSILFAEILQFTNVFQTMELKLLDMRFSLRGTQMSEESPVVIIGIDDQSDESTPDRWPWPRSYYAHVIENLMEAGAAVICIDVMLDQADSQNPEKDDELAAVLQKYNNVVLTGKLLTTRNLTYSTLIPPYEKFLVENGHWGLAALEADLDGFYRRYPITQTYNDSIYPSLAAEVILSALPAGTNKRLDADDDYFYLGPFKTPKFDDFGMLINFIGPAHSFTYYPFDNILDDEDFEMREDYDYNTFDFTGDSILGIPPGLKYSNAFRDKIVLIGSTMQELHDNFPTPFLEYRTSEGETARAEMPGVEIHANTILNILSGEYLYKFPESLYWLLMIIVVGFVFLCTRFFKATFSSITFIIVISAYLFLVFYIFLKSNMIMSAVAPILAALFSFIGYTIYNYFLAQQEKKMVRSVFAHYVPDSVIKTILDNPAKLALGGEERVVSVMFTDIAGFTTISEKLKPKELVAILNDYLTEMTDIVLKHDGIIDKFEGDAIMAEFGVPVTYPGHAKSACRAALEMQRKLKNLRRDWAKKGKPEIYMRVGINTGEMIVGNMGSRDVFDYTVMGDHVNLGARLESANKFYGTDIMISEFTFNEVKDDFFTRPLDLLRVKGKEQPIEVFELLATKETKFSEMFFRFMEYYEQGVNAYRSQKWAEAIALFERCLKLNTDDKPAAIYLKRSKAFQQEPPGEEWDGVTTLTEK